MRSNVCEKYFTVRHQLLSTWDIKAGLGKERWSDRFHIFSTLLLHGQLGESIDQFYKIQMCSVVGNNEYCATWQLLICLRQETIIIWYDLMKTSFSCRQKIFDQSHLLTLFISSIFSNKQKIWWRGGCLQLYILGLMSSFTFIFC